MRDMSDSDMPHSSARINATAATRDSQWLFAPAGARDIRMVCLLAAPEGVERFRGLYPDVPLWTAGIDQGLDDNAFILPGLGDAGDRAYGTR
jgi:uracil phosphoribosyltransferase